jgi:dihydroorotate dehydrogenase (NAD+) catalytic subunit
VAEVARAHNVPIIGQGGISSASDALEFLLAGAGTVGVGTALFYDPLVCDKINSGLAEYLSVHGLPSIVALTGDLHVPARRLEANYC